MANGVDDATDRCIKGRCWTGPILVVGTKGGGIIDLHMWVRVMLSKHYPKEATLNMIQCVEWSHVHEEHAIFSFATGREPLSSILREIYVRAMLDHNGVLRSNCATYHFAIVGQDEQERCDALADHYDWLARVSARSKAMKGASA